MNSVIYGEILYDKLIPYIAAKFDQVSDVVLHQDNGKFIFFKSARILAINTHFHIF